MTRESAKVIVQNPHDRFFKQAFRHHDVAAAQMTRILSKDLRRHLDLEHIALDETIGLNAQYNELFSDRLFRVPLKDGGEVFVWLLIEHQSTDQPMMPLRLLEYAASRWRGYRTLHKDARHIPLLIPIVIQHDPKGWTAPMTFAELYNASPALLADVGPYAINFRYLLDDLQAESEDDISARCPSVALRAVLLALKNGGAIEVSQASQWGDLFTQLATEQNTDLIHDLLWYFIQRGSEAMIQRLEKENPTVQQAAETILDRKFNEGEAKGRIEGTRDMLRSLLIAKPSFRVTDEVETRLQSASLEDLQQWATRLFLGESVDDVLGL